MKNYPELYLPNAQLEPIDQGKRNFLKCTQTGVIYNTNKKRKQEYEAKYFMQDYKNQYGLNYVEEEFQHRERARKYLTQMQRINIQGRRLLEIGCATGFFLHEAQKQGYQVEGIEISKFAQNYAEEVLRLKVFSGCFLEWPVKKNYFDVIAFFYFLEHLEKQPTTLKKMLLALKTNGLLIFTLPSYYGPLFYFQRNKWFETHPQDHLIDYSPQSLRRICEINSLELLHLVPASYHPERFFPFYSKFPVNLLYKLVAKQICFGDTMFGIARKISK